MKLLVVLTQYKRTHLERQLQALQKQTLKPDFLVVFQNESHVDITDLKQKYNFIHIHNDYNTKFFGRFAACFSFPVDVCVVFDDDMIPGEKCLESYVNQCVSLDGIIGGNGRYAYKNGPISQPPDIGLRPRIKVDFVGHVWCFKKQWLHYMFAIPPLTYDTGEDMHLCYSSRVLGNIASYIGEHNTREECSDTTMNGLCHDQFASYVNTPRQIRVDIENYFISLFINYVFIYIFKIL